MSAQAMADGKAAFPMDAELSIINPFPKLLDGPTLLHQLISGPQVDAIALDYTDADGKQTCLSYSELHAQAEKLARRLVRHRYAISESQPGIVPLYISQCPSLYISILGILKSGAAFCPLNMDVPEERLKFILKDTNAKVILTTSELRSKLPSLDDVKIIIVDADDTAEAESQQGDNSELLITPEPSLAYIMYTSGSTGLPKAVCLPHLAVTQSLLAHDKHIPSFRRFLQFASPTFDVSVFEIFFPWIRGSTLVSCDRGRLLTDLPGMMTTLNVDAAELTPSVAASLVRKRENVPTLRTLLTIGEMLNVQVIQEFGGSESRSSMLYGMYGPTEAAIHCTLQPSFGADMPPGTIGIPLDTVSCLIVKPAESADKAGVIEILPLGEVGELAVGGHQLASGYLNREEQTRAAFVSHPVYGNLYRTGDKARLLPSGVLECQGRISSGQVKLRGQRIELGEIEHAASKVAGCHAVVASVISNQLVVFCIVEDDNVTVDDIKNACRKWLPNYMVPSDVILLKDFPYLPSGKVDKRALESDYKSRSAASTTDSSDMSNELRKLVDVMKRVLNIDMDASTELGAAGVDSLKAIHLASELRKEGFDGISALDLLASRTARDLEKSIQSKKSSSAASDGLAKAKSQALKEIRDSVMVSLNSETLQQELQEVSPCTPLQDAMLSETNRNAQAYCNSFELSLPSETDFDRLRSYISLLAERHPLLRSGFCVSGTSSSVYSQLTWKQISEFQILEVVEFEDTFSITDETMLLHPLRIQCKHTTDGLHVLFQLHHALYDQWSIEILMDNLNELIRGGDIAQQPSFQAVNDFYLELKLSPSSQSESIEFWQSYLSQVVPGQLPHLDGEARPNAPLVAEDFTMDIDMSLVRKLAQDNACSAHVIFQAGFTYLLSMYMGTSDVTFGTVFSGRTLPIADVESIFGPMLSTLPTRIDISEARKFSDILRKLHTDNRDIMQHSTVPLADIKKVSNVSPGRALFDSIFVWQETVRTSQADSSLVELVDTHDYLEFNLTLEMEPCQNGIKTKATYQPSLLPKGVITLMLQQLEQVVRCAIQTPDVLINDICKSFPETLLSMANPEPQHFVYKKGLGSVLEKHAEETPDKLALSFAKEIDESGILTEDLTYGELNARANQMAHFLISIGTLPDELVCICMDKSVDLYVGILAIVKAGAAYLPLVPETPAARVQQILSDAHVKTCLVDATTKSMISDLNLCEMVDPANIDLSAWPESSPEVGFDPLHLSYAVFTSGTTGKPKGVLVTQENILSNLTVLKSIYPVSETSRLLQACNQAFDVSVFEIFFTWLTGMCLCSATKDVLFRDLETAINRFGVTHLSLTPTVAALINPHNVPNVEFLVTAGEAVTPQVHRSWAGRGLYQGYGPSETTNICTVNPAVRPEHAINNIGPAFENTSAFVLPTSSDGFQPLPFGALGELCFGGQQVFRGYQNMEELTQSKIINHNTYGRIYRSGDLGRMLPDGTMLIEGRNDNQRKLRGQRIELGEISSALLRSAGVHDCSIQIVGETKEQERLVAFWIPTDRHTLDYAIIDLDESIRKTIDTLFNTLAAELPVYMVPTVLIPLTTLPMTTQGKIDRRRLIKDFSELSPEVLAGYSQAFEDSSSAEPLSDTERALIAALAEVLQAPIASIHRNASFFAFGLDSVSAIRFSRVIKDSLGVQVDVSTILRHPSVARLAGKLQTSSPVAATKDEQKSLVTTIFDNELKTQIMRDFEAHGKAVQSILPCTPLQEAMLFASSAASAGAYYNRTLFRLKGDVSKLKECWKVMVERHDILRTAFKDTGDRRFPYLQVVLAKHELPWESDVTHDADVEKLLQPVSNDEVLPVLGPLPPYRLRIYEHSSGPYLLLEMHHAMYDGNAMSNLLQDVEQAYRNAELMPPSKFAPFLDYMLATDLQAADTFFHSHLDQFVPKPFPKCKAEETRRGFGVQKAQLPLAQSTVQEFLRRHTVTLLGLAQAAWAKVLSTSQGYSDVCFGNVVSGRSVPVEGVQSLVAPCFNTIPVRVDTGDARSNLALIKALQQFNVDVLPFQLMPLRRVQAKESVEGQHLFDSLVLLQQEDVDLDEKIWQLAGESGEMDFPCIVELVPGEETLQLSLHFDRSYFNDDETPSKLCSAFIAAFSSCIKYPSSDVLDLMDFDRREIAGLLKPDDEYLRRAEAALRERANKQDTKASTNENWSPLELEIRRAFSTVSGTPEAQISRNTTIYRIGLDSISAIQVASRLREQGVPLTVADLMESPSCSQLASVVQSRSATPVDEAPVFDLEAFDQRFRAPLLEALNISESQISAVRPCTAMQAGMISQYLQSDGKQYLNHTFYILDRDVTTDQLARAWAEVVRNHEILRTGFASTDDAMHPFAMLTYNNLAPESTRLQLEVQNKASVSFVVRQQAAVNAIQKDIHFPPWRWDLFEHDGKKCLQFSAHHALFDAETLKFIQIDLQLTLSGERPPSRASISSAVSLIVGSSLAQKDEQQVFWHEQLKDLSITQFPNLSPVRATDQAAIIVENICETSRSQLEAICREKSISLQAAGQAAWAQLLAAYTGESRVTFGVVSSGRTTSETASCPFPCITTLPVVADTSLAGEKLLSQLMAYNASVRKHQFTPLTDIQRYAGYPNEALFDTLFAYQKSLQEDMTDQLWQTIHEDATVDYSISIELESLPHDKLGFRLTMNDAQVPAAQGRIMLQQLESLMLSILGTPIAETSATLAIVPAKDPVIPTDVKYLHEFVSASVQSYPERTALEFVSDLEGDRVNSRSWSYRQLDQESNRIAQLLLQHGVQPNGVVAACFDKCPEASFAFLGILKAGCAFCAIDPTAPTARKAFILEDSKASILLTSASTLSELKDSSRCEIIDIIGNEDLKSMSDKPVPEPALQPDSVSYVLYTSGTTGTPKGCELTHDNAVQALLAFQRIFEGRWNEGSRWLQFASYHFDVAVLEQFWTWSVGIRLVCAPRDLILEDLPGFINALQISHLDLTPSLGRLLDPATVPSLHQGVFITGGEAVKQDMIESWGDYGCLFNFYGPTECTIGVTTFPSVPRNGKPSNIGWQFDNVGSYVLAPGTQKAVLRGAIGELCISGRLVGKGYLNRPELTLDRFPYLEQYGERVYRTGDLVRLLHDNSIEFLGRQDNQVKLRGQRLEIDEIEAVIRACPEIQDVVCLVAKHPKQQKDLLVAFIGMSSKRKQCEPRPSPVEASRKLIEKAKIACEERLPGYMVPTHFIPVEEIPLSVNNKVEEKQLRKLYGELPSSTIQEYATFGEEHQPLNDTEKKVAHALATLLNIEESELQASSNIFAVGLSSISAIQFSRKLKSDGFESAHVATVMKNPTIGRLAKALSSSSNQDNGEIIAAKQSISACQQRYMGLTTRLLGGKTDDYEAIAPCTPLQQGLISRSMNADSLLYFNAFRYNVRDIDENRLRDIFQTATEKTQSLRISFVETDDGYIQVVRKSKQVVWLDLEASDEQAMDKILSERRQKWGSANTPHIVSPFELVMVHMPTGKVLEVHIHHALYDGVSYQLLLDNITLMYSNHTADFGRPFIDVLPYGPLRQVKGAKEFWLEHLAGVQQELMPAISSESAQDTLYSTTTDQLAGANSLRQSLNVTLQAIVQAAWSVTLRKYYSGAIGTIVSGRSLDFDGAEKVLGPLFNTIPFNPQLTGDKDWKTLVQDCHNFNISALPFQHTPIRDITKWCRAGPAEPLFDTLFVFQSMEMAGSQQPLLVAEEETQFQADYPLSFEVEDSADGLLKITIAAKNSICSLEKAEQLVDEFNKALSMMISAPETKLGQCLDHDLAHASSSSRRRNMGEDMNGVHDFTWTPEARLIQAEIASLAAVDISEVDEHVSIFGLGLDSVDAVKLSSRLKKKGITVPVSGLMRSQTIPRIVSAITSSKHAVSEESSKKKLLEITSKLEKYVKNKLGERSDIERVLPASPMQEALVTEMLKTSYETYFNHDVLRISDEVDVDKFEKAWEQVIASSPILRTGFLEIEDPDLSSTFAQVVKAYSSFQFVRIDLPEDNFQGYMKETQDAFSSGSLSEPHLRLTLATTPSGRYLVLSIAHALYDGYSLSLMHQDVNAAYYDQFKPRPFYDEVLEQVLSASDRDSASFWRSLLAGATKTHLSSNAATEMEKLVTHRKERASAVSANTIAAFCRKQGVTVQALCQAAWSSNLAYLTQTLDVMYGVVLAGRDSQVAEQVMFPTMNTVVMRSILHGSKLDMLQYMQGNIADIVEHQHFPLRKIQAACQKDVKSVGPTTPDAFFDCLFTFQKQPSSEPSAVLYESVIGASEVDYPVAVEAEMLDDNLVWRTACRSSVFSEAGTEQMLKQLDDVLHEIVSRPDSPLLSFDGKAVSICGLPPFNPLKSDESAISNSSATNDQETQETTEWTDLESDVRQIIAQVTRTPADEITKHTPLQNLGVDSINAIKIAALLRKKSMKISVSQIARAGSIAKMVDMLHTAANQTTSAPARASTVDVVASFCSRKHLTAERFGFDQQNVERMLPATAGQVYMLSAWQTTKGQVFFPEFEYVLRGSVDVDAIRDAWNGVVTQHEILRTVFSATGDEETPFVQIVLRNAPGTFIDLDSAKDISLAEIEQPYVRLSIKKVADTFKLGLKIHHALYDAISLPLLVSEFEQLLRSSKVLSPQHSFSDFIALSIDEKAAESRKQFWTQYMHDAKTSPRSIMSEVSPSSKRLECFDPAVMPIGDQQEAALRKEGLSMQALFFAAYAKAYSGLANDKQSVNTNDVVIGIYIANRTHMDDLSSLAAPTVNIVPVRVKSPRQTPLVFIAKQIQTDLQNIGTPENSSVGLWEIEKWTGVKVDTIVNFIKLPDQTDVEHKETAEGGSIVVEEANLERRTEKRCLVHDASPAAAAFTLPKELANNPVVGSYPVTLDIEATVANGALGVGVFGWEEMMKAEEANNLVEEIAQGLKEALNV